MSHEKMPAVRQPETARAPAEERSIKATIRRALKAPLTYIGAILVAYKPVVKAVYWVIDFYGNMQTVEENFWAVTNAVADFLNTGWGTVVLMAVGFGLIALQLYLQHRRVQKVSQPSEATGGETSLERPPEVEGKLEEETPEKKEEGDDATRSYTSVSPMFLIGLYRHPPDIAEERAGVWVGRWMRLKASVSNIWHDPESGFTNIDLAFTDLWEDGSGAVPIYVDFKEEFSERLKALKKGETVNIVGKIKSINRSDVRLHEGELVDSGAIEPKPEENVEVLTPERLKSMFEVVSPESHEFSKLRRQLRREWIGKDVQISGFVYSVLRRTDIEAVMATFVLQADYKMEVVMYFDEEWYYRLKAVGQSKLVQVRGQIKDISAFSMKLENCELLDA